MLQNPGGWAACPWFVFSLGATTDSPCVGCCCGCVWDINTDIEICASSQTKCLSGTDISLLLSNNCGNIQQRESWFAGIFMPQATVLAFRSERLVFSLSEVKVRKKSERGRFSFSLKMFFHYSVLPLSTFHLPFHFSWDLSFPSLHLKVCELKKHPCMPVSSGDCHRCVGARTRMR